MVRVLNARGACLGQGGHGCLNLLAPAMGHADVASFVASGSLDFCWPPMRFKVSEWNLNYHVPQCTDLPGRRAGSIWRCRVPGLKEGRPYDEAANVQEGGGVWSSGGPAGRGGGREKHRGRGTKAGFRAALS